MSPSIDPNDIISIEFENAEFEDPDFKFEAVVDVAYGHRYLAGFILDHWGHELIVDSDDVNGLWVSCHECEVVFGNLDKESLRGME